MVKKVEKIFVFDLKTHTKNNPSTHSSKIKSTRRFNCFFLIFSASFFSQFSSHFLRRARRFRSQIALRCPLNTRKTVNPRFY